MSVKADLIAARKLIEKPENWTRYGYVEEHNGIKEFALPAAIWDAVIWSVPISKAYVALTTIAGMSLMQFNMTHTHAEVLELLDRAIAAQTEG